jgi:hypothetical protein
MASEESKMPVETGSAHGGMKDDNDQKTIIPGLEIGLGASKQSLESSQQGSPFCS